MLSARLEGILLFNPHRFVPHRLPLLGEWLNKMSNKEQLLLSARNEGLAAAIGDSADRSDSRQVRHVVIANQAKTSIGAGLQLVDTGVTKTKSA